ncbi:MAG: hypothetical protein AAFR76_01375 [Planctomycetota bacterium]
MRLTISPGAHLSAERLDIAAVRERIRTWKRRLENMPRRTRFTLPIGDEGLWAYLHLNSHGRFYVLDVDQWSEEHRVPQRDRHLRAFEALTVRVLP